MKFTYIKLSKNQEKSNEKEFQNEVNEEKNQNRFDIEKLLWKKSYSKGKHSIDKNQKKDNQKILNVKSEEKFLNKSYREASSNYKTDEKRNNIKKLLSKNQVALYTISLMLIVSGYFNYTNNLKTASLGDAQLVSTNLSVSENEEINETGTESIFENITNETSIEPMQEDKENESNETSTENEINETIQSSNNMESKEYFAQMKLERDKMYSQMIETYEKILENNNISTDQKNTASEEIKNINNKRNGIATSETLIKAKEIEDVVIIVNGEVVDAVIKSKENLTTEQIAQVSNIISRELNTDIQNIHITTHE